MAFRIQSVKEIVRFEQGQNGSIPADSCLINLQLDD